MRRALDNDLILLTNHNICDYVAPEMLERDWQFSHKSGHLSPELMSIVAKSDFLRMQLVGQHGGTWIDADTIVLRDYRAWQSENLGDKLLWHSEQFFCSRPGNPYLLEAANAMRSSERLVWGDPGGIKAAVQANKADIDFIPTHFYDPGFQPPYGARSYEAMFRTDLEAEGFLTNGQQCIQKMYNSAFVKFIPRDTSVEELINSGNLLAKIFFAIDPNRQRWIDDAAEVGNLLISPAATS